MVAAMIPRPGAAKGVVPKNGMGMAFCSAGVRHGERHRAERDGRRHQARWDVGGFEKSLRHRYDHENGDEQAYATVSDDSARQDDGEHGAGGAKTFRHEAGND
jgi:hypothetical protein